MQNESYVRTNLPHSSSGKQKTSVQRDTCPSEPEHTLMESSLLLTLLGHKAPMILLDPKDVKDHTSGGSGNLKKM